MNPTMIHIEAPYIVTTLCGAVILMIIDKWLRRKAARDPSIVWLYVSLLSWSAASGLQLLTLKLPTEYLKLAPSQLLYIISPVSTVLLALTAFRLTRVRELFQAPEVRHWPRTFVITVSLISAAAWFLMWGGWTKEAKFIDASASALTLIALGLGLMYSFHKFGHQLLVGLTGITYLICVAGQFYMAFSGSPKDGWIIAVFLVDYTMLTMLFIALAVAWGLMDTSRARPVGISANVNVAVIFVDLRSSTQWAIRIAEKDFHYVKIFIDGLREWCLSFAESSALGRPRIVKFLGDGFLLVWEIQDISTVDSANAGARLAYALSTHYQPWVRKNKHKFFWGAPEGIGVGFDVGPALRLTFENGAEDYLGAPMSLATKMQNLARPCGGVVMQEKAWGLLNGLRGKFPHHGVLKFGDAEVPIRMTEDVVP